MHTDIGKVNCSVPNIKHKSVVLENEPAARWYIKGPKQPKQLREKAQQIRSLYHQAHRAAQRGSQHPTCYVAFIKILSTPSCFCVKMARGKRSKWLWKGVHCWGMDDCSTDRCKEQWLKWHLWLSLTEKDQWRGLEIVVDSPYLRAVMLVH